VIETSKITYWFTPHGWAFVTRHIGAQNSGLTTTSFLILLSSGQREIVPMETNVGTRVPDSRLE